VLKHHATCDAPSRLTAYGSSTLNRTRTFKVRSPAVSIRSDRGGGPTNGPLNRCLRYAQEPRRMWRRYLVGNLRFALIVLRARLFHPRRRVSQTKP
jgi:hypothetical protein